MPNASAVVLDEVSFQWPDGTPVLDGIDGSFSHGRTGLVGANGTGKSTLLRLVAGLLQPTSGTITTSGVVDYLPQSVTRGAHTVTDLLGIGAVRRALAAVESGSVEQADYDLIGDDWDIEERAVASLSSVGVPTDLDRPVESLSGGEAMLTAITGIRLRGADIALLDEPTNNLDLTARQQLYDVVDAWRGPLIVVSHDLALLDRLDATAELRAGGLTTFGGPYDEYRAWLDVQQSAAAQSLRNAEQALKKQVRERAKAEERIAHRERQGRKDRANRKYVPAVINDRRNAAEKAAGSARSAAGDKVTEAREAVAAAELGVRDDDTIKVDLPDPQVPRGRRLAELPSFDGRIQVIQGPERVALIGPNGVGKTTLVSELAGATRIGLLPQRIDLDDDASVLDVVATTAPGVATADLRDRLARLLIRGAMVDRAVGTLSGGERFRVALARLLLAEPAYELLVLDEPTNDLDVAGVDQLVQALAAYRGGLLVVSHDVRFLERLGLDRVLELGPDRVLREGALPE